MKFKFKVSGDTFFSTHEFFLFLHDCEFKGYDNNSNSIYTSDNDSLVNYYVIKYPELINVFND